MSTSQASGDDRWAPGGMAGSPVFVTTHWSVVLSAREANSPESAQALETLCRTYWLPLYVFVRRLGHNPQDAQDLTQEFFARLLQKQFLQSAQRAKGRFRTFLLVSLKRFLANEWDRQHAQKRGGFAPVVSIDQDQGESCLAWEAAQSLQPDALYDRQWAMTLLERTMARLREEYAATGRAKLFERLEPCLAREQSALPYAQIAKELNLSEAAVKMAVQRSRARYRELLRGEIAATVQSPGEVEEEIRYLFSTFSR